MSQKPSVPLTRAEESNYQATSRHIDVMRFLAQLQERGDPRLAIESFGASPEGRELPLLVVSGQGIRTPEQAWASGLPVVLIINGIHPGEVEGKEASLMLVRDLLSSTFSGLLDHMVLLIVPLFNPDGNDRISPDHRRLNIKALEGQLGPASGVGTRTTAAGINLNRDYMRQQALEMRLLQAHVCQVWQPHLTIDCHATNGSVHRFALTYDIPHTVESGRSEPIFYMREQLLPVVTRRLKERTGLDTFYYGNFVTDEGGTGEGWMTYPHHPRFGTNYRGLTNRLDLLLETYSYLPFAERVSTTYEFLMDVLHFVSEHGDDMIQVVEKSQHPPENVAVRYKLEPWDEPATILTCEPRTLEGAPASVTIPHLARFVGTEVVKRPWAYAVPKPVARHLMLHGLALRRLVRDIDVAVEVARVEPTDAEASRRILEASSRGERELTAEYRYETRRLPAESYLVPTDQPLGAIAVYFCEARSDDGVVACDVIAEPAAGEEFPVLRVLEPVD